MFAVGITAVLKFASFTPCLLFCLSHDANFRLPLVSRQPPPISKNSKTMLSILLQWVCNNFSRDDCKKVRAEINHLLFRRCWFVALMHTARLTTFLVVISLNYKLTINYHYSGVVAKQKYGCKTFFPWQL